jgi:hypothetical protein
MPEIIVEVLGPGYTRRRGIAHKEAPPRAATPAAETIGSPRLPGRPGRTGIRRRFKIIIQNGPWRPSRAPSTFVGYLPKIAQSTPQAPLATPYGPANEAEVTQAP